MGTLRWWSNTGKATVSQIGAVFLLSFLTIVLISLTVNLHSADAQKQDRNCADLLVDNLYTCAFNLLGFGNATTPQMEQAHMKFFDFPGAGTFFVFLSGNTTAGNSTLSFAGECQCGAEGSFRKPRFGEAREVFCQDPAMEQILTGRAGFQGIKQGQLFRFFPGNATAAAVFQCVRGFNVSK